MGNAIEAKRLELDEILRATMARSRSAPAGDAIVHTYPPAQLTGLAVYIDMPRLAKGYGTVQATFPVVVAFDGDDSAQTAAMDEIQALLWDALSVRDGYGIETADPESIDVGGARVRALAFLVAVDLMVSVLCPEATHLTT